MRFVIQGAKLLGSLALAWLGYVMLDTARWAAIAAPLSLHIPPQAYDLRVERLGVGWAILALGALAALSAVITVLFPKWR